MVKRRSVYATCICICVSGIQLKRCVAIIANAADVIP